MTSKILAALAAWMLSAVASAVPADPGPEQGAGASDPVGGRVSSPASVLLATEVARRGFVLLERLDAGPKIDGDLSDWPGSAPGISMPDDRGGPGVGAGDGSSDLSAVFRTGWDDARLYLAVSVSDDKHNAPASLPMWHRDGLRIAVDPLHERTLGGLGVNDSELAFALLNDGRTVVEAVRFPLVPGASVFRGDPGAPEGAAIAARASAAVCLSALALDAEASGIRFAARPADGAVAYELAIPWTLLGVAVTAGSVRFGFNLALTDNDGLGRESWLEFAPGLVPAAGMERNAAAYATAVGALKPFLLLEAGGTARPDRPAPLTAAMFFAQRVPPGVSVIISLEGSGAAGEHAIRVPVPGFAGGMALAETEWTLGTGATRPGPTHLSAFLVDAKGAVLADASCELVTGPSNVEVGERLRALRPKLAEAERLAGDAEGRGIATDYERVALAAASLFIDYGIQDLEAGLTGKVEHTVRVLDEALGSATAHLRSYLSGRTRPREVPRFRTGRIELRDGRFWADTMVPATGKKQRRPVFFMGYGFFARVIEDIPRFEQLGCNLIQSAREGGGGATVIAEDMVADGISISSVPRAAQHNVAVDWLSNTEYFPHWARNRWPQLEGAGGAFYDVKVDAPQARKIFKLNLEACLRAIGDNPALLSVCLLNEPTSQFWDRDQFRLRLWREHLERKHGTIEKVNALEGTDYPSFEDVPVYPTRTMPPDEQMTPLRYEQVRFNMDRFAQFHRFLTGVIHEARPGTLTHTKTMAVLERHSLHYGTDPDQFSFIGDLNGNDTWNKFVGFGDRYATLWWRQDMFYDLQRSLRPVPIINSENHVIAVNDPREIPAAHTDFVLWQGCIHGMAASAIWVWEHFYEQVKVENPPDYYLNDTFAAILTRPENVMAVGRVGLDLMRLAPEVYKMQTADAPVAILYGITAQIWSQRAWDALLRAYEAMSFNGLPVTFVSERQVREGGLSKFRAVVLPAVRHAPGDVARAIADYASSGGGEVWIIGDPAEALAHDEYGRPRKIGIAEHATRAWPETASPMELRASLLEAFEAAGVQRRVRLTREDGSEPWAVDYRAVPDGQGHLVSLANYWGTLQRLRILVDGKAPSSIRDLRRDRAVSDPFIELQPLEAMLLRVE